MSKRIDTTGRIEAVRLQNQGAAPSAPTVGYSLVFTKSDGLYLETSDGGVVGPFITGTAAVTNPNHPYYQYSAAALEPDALETFKTGTFSYVIGADETKMLLASYNTRIGSAGRMEVRNPTFYMTLRAVTLTGLGTDASAVVINPSTGTYTDARDTYYDRLQSIAELPVRQVNLTAPTTNYPLLLGAYGGIITRVVNFDFDWIIGKNNGYGFNLANEINDGASAAQRMDSPLRLALSKKVVGEVTSGAERSGGVGKGTVAFVLCPSTWSVIPDPNTYDFRDDFMGSSLDTATKWTRAQSSAGNVEINTVYQWLKIVGNGNWGQNGIYSQTGISRAAGKVFMVDVFVDRTATSPNRNLVVGFSDGGGQSYSNFAHGIDFTEDGGGTALQIFENNNSRGIVGNRYSLGSIYRIRITIGASNNATYEIQGGPEYPLIGGSVWANITPGTSSSSTTPLYAGATKAAATGLFYLSDIKIY